MLEVRPQERKGCLWMAGSVLSLGVLPLLVGRVERQLPWQLTDEEMVLRNGTRIPWSQFTGAKGTRIYLGDTYMGTRWILRHTGGKVEVATQRIHDGEAVMQYILSRIPAPPSTE